MNSSKSYKKYLLFTVIWGVNFMILKSLRSERSRSFPLSVLELCSKASAAQRSATAILFSRPRGRCCWPRRSETTTNNFPINFNQVAGSRFIKNPWRQEDPETSKETDLVSDFFFDGWRPDICNPEPASFRKRSAREGVISFTAILW